MRGRGCSPVLLAGAASYLDAGALITTGFALGGGYGESLELDDLAIGVLLALQTLCFAIGSVVGGRLADLHGRRAVLVWSLLLFAVGAAVLAVAGSAVLVGVGVVATGLGIGADLPASIALVAEAAPVGRKARSVALTQLLWGGGIGVAALGAFLMSGLGSLGPRLLFGHLVVVAVVVLVARVGLVETAEWTLARQAGAGPAQVSAPAPRRTTGRTPAVLAIAAYGVLWLLGANTMGQFKTFLWVHVLDGSDAGASALILASFAMGTVGSVVFALVADSALRRPVVAAGSVATASVWAILVVSPERPAFVAAALLSALGATLAGEAFFKVTVHELVPTLSRATVQGAATAVARVVAAGFAVVTPALATAGLPRLAGLLLVTQLLALVVAVVWIPLLGRSRTADRPAVA